MAFVCKQNAVLVLYLCQHGDNTMQEKMTTIPCQGMGNLVKTKGILVLKS